MPPPFGSWPDLILESSAAFLQSTGDPWGDAVGAPLPLEKAAAAVRGAEDSAVLPLGDPFHARDGRVFVLR